MLQSLKVFSPLLSQVSWQYLREVQSLSSPLLHTWTFLLARISHLLFLQGRAWTVSELCISTLHTMAREINMLKVREWFITYRIVGNFGKHLIRRNSPQMVLAKFKLILVICMLCIIRIHALTIIGRFLIKFCDFL